MTNTSFARRFFAGALIAVFAMSALVQARPLKPFSPLMEDEKRPLPAVNWIRSRHIDVKHLDIDLRFDWDKEQAIGVTTVTLAPFADTNTIELDAAMMTINSVKLAGGGALQFAYDAKKENDNLEITLDRVYRAGEDVKVVVDYRTNYVNKVDDTETAIGSFGRGLRFIKPNADNPNKPRQIWSQGESEFNRYWFPSYDSPNDFRTTEMRATVAKPFTVVGNGKLTETKDNGDGTRTFVWKMEQPYTNYLTSIVVSETTPVVQDFDGIPVYNYGYVNETKEVAATVKNLPATMRFFSEITGVKYPYAKYSQAFVEEFGGGMENISATTQIEEMIHDERELLDTDSEGLQSHELAHQWFGDYVTCRDWGQIWLNESFATYMQAMWTEKLKGHDEFLYTDVRGNQNATIGTWNQGNRRPIVTKYYANKDAMFDTYAYPGGGSVLHMLRKHLGDKAFFASLKHYLTQNAHQPVSTEDLRIAIEETTGQSMDWFFDQWLNKMGHPIFEVTQNYDEAKKQLTLNVKQTQKIDLNNEYPQTDYFQSYVDVAIDNKVSRVWLKPQAENVFTFDSAAKPKLVNFDYEGTLLKEMKFEKSTDDLLYQMANDKDPIGRRWAMAELAQQGQGSDKAKIVAALIISAEKDTFWRMRRAALSEIANIYSPDPPPGQDRPAVKLDANVEAAVMRLTKDKETGIRGDALELLGETQDKKFGDMLLAGLSDRSYEVIDQSALGLARVKDPRAYEALVKLTSTPSWKGRIQIAGFNGLAELGDPRGFEAAYKSAIDKSLPFNVRTAALVVVGETGKGDPRAYPLIYEKFKAAFDSNNIQGMVNGIQAIVRLADPRGQEALDMLRTKFKDNPGAMQFVASQEAALKAAIKK
ncbi:MAG: hypothetical protein KA746_04905 [Pyrinomonadaceae bacterium]|nr:hypothetical protein [Pyrinomonadaceae bacterium]